MNQRQLECFLRVAETGSICKAAEELFLSQPSVTYQIASLEKETGQRLFERGPHGTRLTEVGRHLVPMARRASDDLRSIDDYIASLRKNETKPIVVLHGQIIHDRLWRSLLSDYAKDHPDIEVRTVFGTFTDELDWPQMDVYIVPQKRLESFYPPATRHVVLYHAWVHGIMAASHALAGYDYIDLDRMEPYPMLFPSIEFMETLGCWYWLHLRESRERYTLEFHEGRSLHEIQLHLFGSSGVFISRGIHTDLAPGIVEVPFTPESPRVEEHICWKEEARPHVVEFVDYVRRYYALRPWAFEPLRGAGSEESRGIVRVP